MINPKSEKKELLEKIKSHKKYSSISDDIIKKEINSYLKFHPNQKQKQIIKNIRAKLHRTYSSYQTNKKNKIEKYLKEPKNSTTKLLETTLSTKERLKNYKEIYKKIFSITGKPKTITDLGAGLNIFSFPFMNLKTLTYYAHDINKQDQKIIKKYLNIMNLKGTAEITDLNNLKKIKKSDIILMFKLYDLLEKNTKKNILQKLITKSPFIVVSFATKSLSRKPFQLKQRTGFENHLKKNNLSFKKFETDNEIFYVISHDKIN